MTTPVQIVEKLLANSTNAEVVESLVAPDATLVSLSYNNPDLKKFMPWCGHHKNEGPKAILQTYTDCARVWTDEGTETQVIFGCGENVAAFGTMTLRSKTLGIAKTSPFSIWCVVKGGLIVFMQYMEDTFDTAATFRSRGSWTFKSDPAIETEVTI